MFSQQQQLNKLSHDFRTTLYFLLDRKTKIMNFKPNQFLAAKQLTSKYANMVKLKSAVLWIFNIHVCCVSFWPKIQNDQEHLLFSVISTACFDDLIQTVQCTVVELYRQGVTKVFQQIEMIETLVFSYTVHIK